MPDEFNTDTVTKAEVNAAEAKTVREERDLNSDRLFRESKEGAEANRPEVDTGEDAAGRLRAFEDEVFGVDAVRINGHIEKGSGSPYSTMNDEAKLQYAALERMVIAEQKLEEATAAVKQAEADRVAAEADLKACEDKAAAHAAGD